MKHACSWFSGLVIVRGFSSKVAIAKVTNAGNNIELAIDLRIQSGCYNFHLKGKYISAMNNNTSCLVTLGKA